MKNLVDELGVLVTTSVVGISMVGLLTVLLETLSV